MASPSPTIAQRVQLVVRCLKGQYNWKHANRVLAVQVGKNTDDIWVCNARAPPEGGNTATACAHFQRMIVSHAICKRTSLPRSTMFFFQLKPFLVWEECSCQLVPHNVQLLNTCTCAQYVWRIGGRSTCNRLRSSNQHSLVEDELMVEGYPTSLCRVFYFSPFAKHIFKYSRKRNTKQRSNVTQSSRQS